MRPGAGAEIEQIAERLVAEHLKEGGFDPLLRRVHRTDTVPVSRLLGEIGGRLPAPRFARAFEPAPIGGHDGVDRIEAPDEFASESRTLLGQAKKGPRAFAASDREPGFDQELQMPRDAGLRLAENGDKLAHRQLNLVEQAEDPEPRLFGRGFEIGEEG